MVPWGSGGLWGYFEAQRFLVGWGLAASGTRMIPLTKFGEMPVGQPNVIGISRGAEASSGSSILQDAKGCYVTRATPASAGPDSAARPGRLRKGEGCPRRWWNSLWPG